MRKLVSVLAGSMMMATGALAQESGISVTGTSGEVISITAREAYRALGDRLVTGGDVIGNNTRNWNQIGSRLPQDRIAVSLLDDADEAKLLYAVRIGCETSSGDWRACEKVGLRRDRVIRSGGGFGGGVFEFTVGQFDPQAMGRLTPIARVVEMPAPAPAPSYVAPAPSPPVKLSPGNALAVVLDNAQTATGVDGSIGAMTGVQTRVQAVPAMVEAAPAAMIETTPLPLVRETSSDPVYASRLFLGRDSFPPESFAAYGILAFPTLSTSEDEARYIAICEAFFSALLNSGDVSADVSQQMVTVWPIDDRGQPTLANALNTTRAAEGSCAKAVEYYDVQIARGAIGDAMQAGISLSGRGPFLLAWAPAGTKGQSDAVVLAADLSDVKTAADAKDVLRIWREDIEGDPAVWQNGFSVEKLRIKLRQIVNRYGDGLLKFLGG